MYTFLAYLGDDHHQCDALFAAAESEVASGHWPPAREALTRFLAAMRRHFAMEEDVLFPAFEQRTGSRAGPTEIMRMEHGQMRELMEGMRHAADASDREAFLGLSETLNLLMQQHNVKEENMLYPMSDRVLANTRDQLIRDMETCRGQADA